MQVAPIELVRAYLKSINSPYPQLRALPDDEDPFGAVILRWACVLQERQHTIELYEDGGIDIYDLNGNDFKPNKGE